jgi:hypothetical protein
LQRVIHLFLDCIGNKKMKSNYLYMGLMVAFFISCNNNPSQPAQLTPLAKWQSFQLHNYTIDQVRWCFCPDAGDTVRMTIRSDTIASILKLSDNNSIPLSTSYYFTIDSLFSIINSGSGDSIVVTYNKTYGYPEKLDVNPQQHPVDGGVLYETSNLQIL